MTNEEYIQLARKTEGSYTPACQRLQSEETVRILHAAFGLSTEAAEVVDALKKHVFYGKPLDIQNLKEELGDVFWYLAVLADEIGISFEEVQTRNIAKLRARYGEKFSEEKAINRDHDEEMKKAY